MTIKVAVLVNNITDIKPKTKRFDDYINDIITNTQTTRFETKAILTL